MTNNVHSKLATQYSNVHLLFLSTYIKWNLTTLYHIHLWILMYIPSFSFLLSSISLSLSFPFYQYLFHHIRIIMYSLRVVVLSKLCLLCQPSCLMFSISYFIRHYILLKCVKFVMFCLFIFVIWKNQTQINKSNVAQNIYVHGTINQPASGHWLSSAYSTFTANDPHLGPGVPHCLHTFLISHHS